MVNIVDYNETTKVKVLAEIIGLSERQTFRLANDGILKKDDKGKYLLYQSIIGYIQHLKESAENPRQLQEEKIKQEIEYLKTRDKKEKTKIRILEADLHESEDVKKIMNNMIAGFKGQIRSLPYKIAPLVIGIDNLAELQEIITDNVNNTLLELSEYDREKFVKNKEYVVIDDELPEN